MAFIGAHMVQYLIICPLVFLAGFVDAIAGGGGLISLPGYLLAGLPAHAAIGTNKISSCLGTTVATVQYGRHGHIPVKESLLAVPFAFLGSFIGTRIALAISDGAFRIVLLVVLPATALFVFFNKGLKENSCLTPLDRCVALPLVAAISLAIGVYDGFYGPGTGTFLMLLFTGVVRMEVRASAGLTKVINLSTNVVAMVSYLYAGTALLAYGLPAAAFSILGNYLGSRCFLKNGVLVVKPVMLLVIGIFFVKTLYGLLT